MSLTGKDKLEFRLSVEGWPYEFVTADEMETTTADGRVRVSGLLRQGLAWSELVNPAEATLDCEGMSISIIDRQRDSAVTAALASAPARTTWLDSLMSTTSTVITMMSQAGFVEGDIVHIGTEAIELGEWDGGGIFTGCTRAKWDTIAQRHRTLDGQTTVRSTCTDVPISLEGRRARLYYYSSGDSLTGAGTQCFMGLCTTDARLESDGSTWTLTIDPISRLLQQEIGSDLADTLHPRGYHYHIYHRFNVYIEESSSSTTFAASGNAIGVEIPGNTYFHGAGAAVVDTRVEGECHYETVEDLAKDVTSLLTAALAASAMECSAIEMIPLEAQGGTWTIMARLGATPRALRVSISAYDASEEGGGGGEVIPTNEAGDSVTEWTASATYYFTPASASLPPVGKCQNISLPYDRRFASEVSLLEMPVSNELYIGGSFDFGSAWSIGISGARIKWPDGEEVTYEVTSTDDDKRSLVLEREADDRHLFAGPVDLPEIRLCRKIASGDVFDFVTALVAASPNHASSGAVPFLTSSDIGLSGWDSKTGFPWQSDREYYAADQVDLDEMLANEFRLVGLIPVLGSSGVIGSRLLTLPVKTLGSAIDLDSTNILVDRGFPTWERNGLFGNITGVVMRTGFDRFEGKWLGPTFVIRDQTAIARKKIRRDVTIAPRSETSSSAPIPPDQAVAALTPIFSLLGGDYAIIRLEVPLHDGTNNFLSATMGRTVTVTSEYVPDVITGARGADEVPGLIVGRRVELDTGRVALTILAPYRRIAGYAPSLTISAETNITGNKWSLTVIGDTPWPVAEEFMDQSAGGDVISDFFEVGDAITIVQADGSTTVAGTIDTVTEPDTIEVTLDGSWTPSTDLWLLMFDDDASDAVGHQLDYGYFANATAVVEFTAEQDAKEWG